MEHIHGVDISWMTHGSSKDKPTKPTSRRRNTLQSQPVSSSPHPVASPPLSHSPPPSSPIAIPQHGAAAESIAPSSLPPLSHPRSPSPSPSSPPPGSGISSHTKGQRRPSWFSNISSKFSSSPGSSPPPQATAASPKQAELSVPRSNPARNAVLQHAAKYEGEGPYTPAPPKSSGQAGLLHVLRRLSSSSGGSLGVGAAIKGNHGLVERRVLNVDHNRQRCRLAELNQAKLRRVSFCVDVEIAPMPKYAQPDPAVSPKKQPVVAAPSAAAATAAAVDKSQRRKAFEKGEGEALRSEKSLPGGDRDGVAKERKPNAAAASASASPPPAPTLPVSPAPPVSSEASAPSKTNGVPLPGSPVSPAAAGDATPTTTTRDTSTKAGDVTRKKEKKKKSEEERKARKERKRRLAEANGTIPMEIYLDSDESDTTAATTSKRTPAPSGAGSGAPPATPRTQLTPTTNPVRIYRRCCQLRETPILKKITEQLSDPAVFSSDQGVVSKLDLTGYWLQLADLVTLGDFLAVVPIREVVLENCGLNDEGLRVVLAGLLAARKPQKKHIHLHHFHRHHQPSGTDSQPQQQQQQKGYTVPVTAASSASGATPQGGFVERLVLKNNKIGVEGWKHICLFVYMCRSLKAIDLANVVFPHMPLSHQSPQLQQALQAAGLSSAQRPGGRPVLDVCELLAKAVGERLGGSTLELLNVGDTGLSADQLGCLVDGLIQCGTRRLGLAHNDLDEASVKHVARYMASGVCEGLDLGGNDLHDWIGLLADAAATNDSLWALSLADCNLTPSSLSTLLPKLTRLSNFRFLDLSHNHALFQATPSATPLLRRYLPMMESLKRLHLADVALTSEQAIALAEVLPEVKELAHLNLLQNPELTKLADARTEETQEQACALYASFLAATRLSTSIVALDMAVPTAESTEIVRAMAKQVLAYCLRNVDLVTLANTTTTTAPVVDVDGDALALPLLDAAAAAAGAAGGDATSSSSAGSTSSSSKTSATRIDGREDYPDVIQHLVGHDVGVLDEGADVEAAPDDDYVIGGTGVAQALECCLKNRSKDAGRPSGEFAREEGGDGTRTPTATGGSTLAVPSKAKDMSKHLLQSARKIRMRLQPALQKARALSAVDSQAYQRLLFLDNTLDGIIKRFEDEFPETRVSIDSGISVSPQQAEAEAEAEVEAASRPQESEADAAAALLSDGEDETEIRPSGLARSNSSMSLSSKGLTNEEGRVLRAGHRFRSNWYKHYNLLSGIDEIESDPSHKRVLDEMICELNDDNLNRKLADKGMLRLFREDREEILQCLKEQDPEHWDRFIESQEKARANLAIELAENGRGPPSHAAALASSDDGSEEAIIDD
ncbi:cell wall biogenesis protein [Niveomyces insectorum RCEF 264]|uniref:Cell wall biogenesis protein n=1 Tax=Niveomyces insectorum RCEF 264 TaxID=1081102 RepID=A0A167ZWG3_9HYPO|nr:cell wall biogenesis protein [Niveomyces insectorum RCEF 264]